MSYQRPFPPVGFVVLVADAFSAADAAAGLEHP